MLPEYHAVGSDLDPGAVTHDGAEAVEARPVTVSHEALRHDEHATDRHEDHVAALQARPYVAQTHVKMRAFHEVQVSP